MKRLRLASLACIAVAAAGTALAPPVVAEERSTRDRAGDVRARGLTPAERRALDITRVTTEAGEAGLIVRVALRGDFDAVVGRRHLRTALAGVVLHPRSRRATPLAIVSTGAGRREDTLASRGVRGPVAAAREEREIAFFAPGVDVSSIRRVEARTFASTPPRGRARGAQLTEHIIDFFRIGVHDDGDDDSVTVVRGQRSCSEIEREIESVERALEQLRSKRTAAFLDRRRIATRELDATIANLESSLPRLEQERAAACPPPGQTPPPPPQPQPPDIQGQGSFTLDPNDSFEVFLDFVFSGGNARAAQAGGVDAIRVVVPPTSDGTARTIIDFVAPPQLPTCSLEQQNVMVCQGGTLAYGQATQMKLRTTPAPATGMGGELFGRIGGSFQGPIQITGP